MESVAIIADSKSKGFDFARGVYDYVCRKEGRSFLVNLGDIERKEFKDTEYKLKISHNLRKKKCFFIHDSNKEACKWLSDLVLTLDAMRFSSPEEVIVVLPYTRFARQDRKDESRVSVNVKAVADIISLYSNRGLTIDLHAPQIQEYFGIPFDNLYSFPVLVNYLKEHYWSFLDDLVVVSPDAGGANRAGQLQKRLSKEGVNADLAICYKKRVVPYDENKIDEIKVMGDVKNKNCLIIDDIIDTGNTLARTGHVLKSMGAKSVIAYGTHGLFTDGLDKFSKFDKILTSDSLVSEKHDNLEVISLVDLFGEAVYRTIAGESLSSLFS
jgi:ribose-phosphate pyrophosphokinase